MSVEIEGQLYSWTQPLCERDWCLQHGGEYGPWEAPVRLRGGSDAEQCCVCGFPTWAGIFIRIDPRTVGYPSPEHPEMAATES